MNPFLILYIIIGLFWIKLENDSLNADFSDMSKKDATFCILHQILHYSRVLLLWPTFLLGEGLLWLYDILSEDEE